MSSSSFHILLYSRGAINITQALDVAVALDAATACSQQQQQKLLQQQEQQQQEVEL